MQRPRRRATGRMVAHAPVFRARSIVVVLLNKIYVYNFADLRLVDHIETIRNPRGATALTGSICGPPARRGARSPPHGVLTRCTRPPFPARPLLHVVRRRGHGAGLPGAAARQRARGAVQRAENDPHFGARVGPVRHRAQPAGHARGHGVRQGAMPLLVSAPYRPCCAVGEGRSDRLPPTPTSHTLPSPHTRAH